MNGSQATKAIVRALACGRKGCACQQSARRGFGPTHCPAHNDNNPSLSVNPSGTQADGLLVHCHKGCSQRLVVSALKRLGLWPKVRLR